MIPHSHKGKEITLVLEGAFSDETGSYKRGDIVIHDQRSSHAPQADQRLGCTVLSIMDGPIQIKASFSFFKFFIRT
jgi:putative transcriptional regulator